MREKPILFSGPMVRAILDGRKTMTRRVVKCDSIIDNKPYWNIGGFREGNFQYQVGSRLWVRETFVLTQYNKPVYKADSRDKDGYFWGSIACDPKGVKWKPSIFMPRWASRITLEITNVRVERLQDITDKDSEREGIGRQMAHEQDLGWRNYLWHGDFGSYGGGNKQTDAWPYQYSTYQSAKDCFSSLWELINGKTYPWASNPWVYVIEFKRAEFVCNA